MVIVSALGRLWQKGHDFEANLGHIERICLKIQIALCSILFHYIRFLETVHI